MFCQVICVVQCQKARPLKSANSAKANDLIAQKPAGGASQPLLSKPSCYNGLWGAPDRHCGRARPCSGADHRYATTSERLVVESRVPWALGRGIRCWEGSTSRSPYQHAVYGRSRRFGMGAFLSPCQKATRLCVTRCHGLLAEKALSIPRVTLTMVVDTVVQRVGDHVAYVSRSWTDGMSSWLDAIAIAGPTWEDHFRSFAPEARDSLSH